MKIMLAVICLALAGCGGSSRPKYALDQALRAERFDACMKALPVGPQSITAAGNDWDEVVEACDNAAYYQANICVANCPGAKTP